MALKVVRIINQPVTSNCFLLYDREVNNDCLVVDPGSEYPDELEQLLRDLNLYPKYILLTHEHFDHIWGCNYLVEKYHSKIICSVLCRQPNRHNRPLCLTFPCCRIQPAGQKALRK